MAFGKPKGKHHSANQVRRGYKSRLGRRSRKHACVTCGSRNYRRVCAECYERIPRVLPLAVRSIYAREVRVATLVEAAQATCGYCFRPDYDLIQDGSLLRHEAHRPSGYGVGRCEAAPLVKMILGMWL